MTFFKSLFISSRPLSLPGLFSVSPSSCSASLYRLASLRLFRLPCATTGLLVAFAVPLFAAASATADAIQQPSRQKTVSCPAAGSLDPGVKAPTPASSPALVSEAPGKSAAQRASTAAHAPLLLTILTENTSTAAVEPATRSGAGIVPNQARFDFGSISSLSQAQLNQTFFLRNDNNAAVTVSQLQSSNGCLQAAFAAANSVPLQPATLPTSSTSKRSSLHQLLPPGQEIPLHITLNSAAMVPGTVDQALWVFVEGQAMPAATLKVTGNLQPLLQFSPRVLNFGNISLTDKHSLDKLSLTMTLDAELIAGGQHPQITCSDPDIKVDLISTTAASVGPTTPMGSAASAGPSALRSVGHPVVQTYNVHLSSGAAPGVLKSRLIFSFASPTPTDAAFARSQVASSQQPLSRSISPSTAPQGTVLVIIPVTGAISK